MLQPWTAKDLNVRALADRINDLSYLRYLYPNIPKDDAFGVFYSPPGGEFLSNESGNRNYAWQSNNNFSHMNHR